METAGGKAAVLQTPGDAHYRVVGGQAEQFLASTRVPHFDSFVEARGGQAAAAVWTEATTSETLKWSRQSEQFAPGRHLPHLSGLIITGGGQARTIRLENYLPNPAFVAAQG